MIVDLFSGPRGWSVGLAELGHRDIGIEWDYHACRTAVAAGHATVLADVSRYPRTPFIGHTTGIIASPPCPAFSAAGKGHGRDLIPTLVAAVHNQAWNARPHHDPEVWLVLALGHWLTELDPQWVCLEQVPAVLPIWRAYAHVLQQLGYSTWCGILNAADYGVPQTRERAILIAHRHRPARPPEPTHAENPQPTLFGPQLLPWVTMAEALPWITGEFVADRLRGAGMIERHGDRRHRRHDEPAPTVTANGGHASPGFVIRTGQFTEQAGGTFEAYTRDSDRPAPTLLTKSHTQWKLVAAARRAEPTVRDADQPAPTVAFGHACNDWIFTRPATTVLGDPRIWPPGHKINADDIDRLGADEAIARYGDRAGSEAIRLTLRDALVLQSFPPDYPVSGTKTKGFEQIGNAVPPLLARHILTQVLDGAS